MTKKINSLLLSAAVLFNTASFAATHNLAGSRDIELPSQLAQTFVNPVGFKVKANCAIKTNDSSNVIEVVGIDKTGSVNNYPVAKGDVFTIVVHQDDILTIVANGYAKVQLTNLGDHAITAHCKF